MEFCIISPSAGLENFASQSHTHLVLPQIRDKTYTNFYRSRRKQGDFLILDNGAYEGAFIHNARLAERMKLYEPQVVACPDALLQDWSITWEMTKRFLTQFHSRLEFSCEFMGIPQALPMDINAWWKCAKRMLEDPRITWIGLPRCLYTHFGLHDELRSTIAQCIHDVRPDIKLHALGMADGSLTELEKLAAINVVESCDSSAPVWRGWQGRAIEDSHDWIKDGSAVDFSAALPEDTWYIEHNLDKVLNICWTKTRNGSPACSTGVAS